MQVGGRWFCIHGGLSPLAPRLTDIAVGERCTEIGHSGLLSDLMWSDPEPGLKDWAISARGAGHYFGESQAEKFCRDNDLTGTHSLPLTAGIIRSHQLEPEGHREVFAGRLWSVWSAPNYCYRCGNKAAFYTLEPSSLSPQATTFLASERSPSSHEWPPARVPEYFL